MSKKSFFFLEEDKMLSKWSMRQKAMVATFFGLAIVTVVTVSVLSGRFKFQASGELGPYDNQANLTYTDSQGQSRNIQSNIVALKKNQTSYPLSGTVKNSAGQPVAGAKVMLLRQVAASSVTFGCAKANLDVTADSNGNYFFTNVSAAEYQLLAVPSGIFSYTCGGGGPDNLYVSNSDKQVAIKTIKTTGAPVQVNLTIKSVPRYHNNLWVWKGDYPNYLDGSLNLWDWVKTSYTLGDARVIVKNTKNGQIVYDGQTDASTGELTVFDEDVPSEGDGGWYYKSYIAKEGYTDIAQSYDTLPLYKYPGGLVQYYARWVYENLNTAPALSGTIKNSNGNPIGRTALVLRSKPGPGQGNVHFVTASKTSDGTFSFTKICPNSEKPTTNCTNIPTGDYTLEVIPTSEYQSTFIDPVHITDGQTTNLGDIILSSRIDFSAPPASVPEVLASLPKQEETVAEPQTEESKMLASMPVVSGTLTDPSTKAPLEAAVVSIKDSKNNVISSTLTDQNGQYTLRSPQTGNYKVEVKKEGYKTKTKKVSLSEGQNLTIDMSAPKQGKFMTWLKKVWAKITQKVNVKKR